jgi:phosphoribosylglycinamide formyltransferase 1
MIPKKTHIAVFLSGRGSNFLALKRASDRPEANFRIVVVISDRKKAPGLDKARRAGIPAFHVAPRTFPDKPSCERAIVSILVRYQVELVCLAGYMRLIGRELLAAFPDRILNIHPALLPAFPGLDAQRQALEYGVGVSGCTVHIVDSGMDSGPIILQQAVPVGAGDTVDTLSARILRREHRLYPRAVQLYCAGHLHISGRRVIIEEP